MKTLKYSEMLKEVIGLLPKEIPCDDAKPIGDEGMRWKSLHNIHDQIDKENNFFKDTNNLMTGLLWSVLVGIVSGFRTHYVNTKKPCTKLSPVEVIDLDKTLEHFKETVDDEDWQEYLKERNETVIYDKVTRDELRGKS